MCRVITEHDDDHDTDRPPAETPSCQKPPFRVGHAAAAQRIPSSRAEASFANTEGRADVLDARAPSALVLVAVGDREYLGDRRSPVGLGDRSRSDGAGELSHRATDCAATIRVGS